MYTIGSVSLLRNIVPVEARIMADAEQALTELLNKIATERALVDPRVETQPITSGGGNFTSHLYQATISDGDNELSLFAKVAAVGKKFREQVPVRVFEVENAFYTRLNKIYEKLQDEHNVVGDERFVSPVCYGCSDTLYEEVVVLENLSAQGFTVYDRLKSVDWAYASKAVEEIAKFHALSVAFEKENKKEFDKFLEDFKFTWDFENNTQFIDNMIEKGVNVIKEENRGKVKAFLEKLSPVNFEEMFRLERLNVLAHCDYRVSNQMYRTHADGRVEVKIVDYQTIRGAPPVLDLLYFIFTGTDEKFRAQHYERLLDQYYTQLSLAMRRLHLNPEEIYSREDFDFEYKAKLPYGLTVAIFSLPLVTVDAENAPKVDKDLDMSSFAVDNTSDLFPERLNGVVNDFIRWGII